MEHRYWEERLQGYLDNELAPADAVAMQAHIDQCEECEANLAYFGSLKRRLKAHSETVTIPEAVEERIRAQFSRKRNFVRRVRNLGMGFSLAAAVLIGFLLPILFQKPYEFESGMSLIGTLTCYDCEVAAKLGMEMGTLCDNDHSMGILCDNGELWRFSGDSPGDMSLMKQQVRIYGDALHAEHIFRVKTLEAIETRQAALILPHGR